jgi:UDP-3-O-[3-hydroxymyristoyl] glucosamine N-acyltransferase
VIGDYVTFSPGVNVSGNVNIGDNCYIGTNAVIREKINICSDVVIGAGGVVVKDITEPGVYVGNPVKKIK